MTKQINGYARWLRSANLQVRLVIVFVLLFLMVVLTGGSGLFFAKRVEVSVDTLTVVALPSLDAIHSLRNNIQQMNVDLLTSLDRRAGNRSEKLVAALSVFDQISRVGLDKLESLLEVSGIDLNTEMARDSLRMYIRQASELLSLHKLKLASQSVAYERIEEFEQQRRELDNHLERLANRSEAAMAVREEVSKTLVQSGKATVERVDELNDATFNQSLPLLQSAYKLMRFLVQIQDLSRSYMATSHTDQLDVIERNVLLIIKRSKSRLRKSIGRASTPEEKAQIKTSANAFAKLEALILAEEGLYAVHLKSLDAIEASVALKKC